MRNIYTGRKDKATANNIDEYLEEGEVIVWEGKPDRKTYIKKCCGVPFIFALIWTIFDSFFVVAILTTGMPIGAMIGVLAFLAVHMTPVWIHIGGRIKGHRTVDSITYYITNQRCIVENQKNQLKFNYVKHKDIISVKTDETNYFNCIGTLTISSPVYKIEFIAVEHYPDIAQVIDDMRANSHEELQTHLATSGSKQTYQCSYCGQSFRAESGKCPSCGARANIKK